jgi:hypothetical protein
MPDEPGKVVLPSADSAPTASAGARATPPATSAVAPGATTDAAAEPALPKPPPGGSVTAALLAAIVSCGLSVPIAAVGFFVIDLFFRAKLMGHEDSASTRIGGEGAVGDFIVALADGFFAALIAGALVLLFLKKSHRRALFLFSLAGYAIIAVVLWRYVATHGAMGTVTVGFWTATVFVGAVAGAYGASAVDLSEEEKNKKTSTQMPA